MKKSSLALGAILVVIVLGGGYYFFSSAQSKGNTHALNADAYPLYEGASWNEGHADTQEGLSGFSITSEESTTTDNIVSVTEPFEKYYSEKLFPLGWALDNSLSAGGAGSSLTAYRKGDTFIVVGYTTKFEGGGENEPVQCPCRVTLGIFSGILTK